MKSKGILVLILSITLIFSITLLLISSGLSKPRPKSELITFEGDLAGSEEVIGCCPNAGPFPEYTMILSKDVFPEEVSQNNEPHDGHIFMNFFGAGKNKQSYLVRFWWPDGELNYFIEVIGGDIEQNRKTKILTVTFDHASCKIWINNIPQNPVEVSFTLTRNL